MTQTDWLTVAVLLILTLLLRCSRMLERMCTSSSMEFREDGVWWTQHFGYGSSTSRRLFRWRALSSALALLHKAIRLRGVSFTHSNRITQRIARKALRPRAKQYLEKTYDR